MPVFFCTSCDCYGEGVFLISLFVFCFFFKGGGDREKIKTKTLAKKKSAKIKHAKFNTRLSNKQNNNF